MKIIKILTVVLTFATITALIGCAANPYANRSSVQKMVKDTAMKAQNTDPVRAIIDDPATVIYAVTDSGKTMAALQTSYNINPATMFNPAGPISRMSTVNTFLAAVLMNQRTNTAILFVVFESVNGEIVNAVMQGAPTTAVVQGQPFNISVSDNFGTAQIAGTSSVATSASGGVMSISITLFGPDGSSGVFSPALPMPIIPADTTTTVVAPR